MAKRSRQTDKKQNCRRTKEKRGFFKMIHYFYIILILIYCRFVKQNTA